jgi:hypothetical protein
MKSIIFFLFLCVSVVSSAEGIFVKGTSYPLEFKNGAYYVPPTVALNMGLNTLYIIDNGINKVCMLNTESSLMYDINPSISININGVYTVWNCFPYITTIIEVRP